MDVSKELLREHFETFKKVAGLAAHISVMSERLPQALLKSMRRRGLHSWLKLLVKPLTPCLMPG